MKIELKKLSDLKPAPYNPRQSNAEQEKQLKSSLEKFGVVEPIIFNKQTGFIVGGHFRIRELKKLGYKEIECVIVDLNEADEKELNIRLNANTGSWDWDELANNWDSELLSDWGLEIPGFEPTILEAEEDDFETPEGGIETDIVLGDLFEIGEHRLLCGDSTDSDAVAKLLKGNKAELLFTDPPYNVGFNGRSGKFDVIENDDLKTEDFDKFIEEFAQTVHTLEIPLKYIWCNWKFYGTLQKHFELNACIVWAKNVFGLGRGYRHQHEFCFFEGKLDDGINNETDLWEVKKDSKYMHPTQKPVELSVRALNNHKKAKNILDLFGGSGSTLVGIHQSNRIGYIMELDPKYCQVIVDRMKKLDSSIKIKRNGIELK